MYTDSLIGYSVGSLTDPSSSGMYSDSLVGFAVGSLSDPMSSGAYLDSQIGFAAATLVDPASPYVMTAGGPVEMRGQIMKNGTPTPVRRWFVMKGGVAVPLTRQSTPPSTNTSDTTTSRLGALYGSYEPTIATAGLLSAEQDLTEYNTSSAQDVTIPNGAVISDKIIYGRVVFAGTAELRNCLLVGRSTALTSGNDGVISCTNTRSGQAKLFDCEIRPRQESPGRNCVLGMQIELYSCWIHKGEDGVGLYPTGGATATNAIVKGCLIEDLGYSYPDRDHSDGSHCDNIQIQGGTNIQIVGNAIRGTAHWMPGSGTYYTSNPSSSLGDWSLTKNPGIIPGSCIIINSNVAAINSTVVINGNYFRYGKAQLLVKSGANNFVCTNNKFSAVNPPASNVNGTVYNGTTLSFTYNSYWIRFDAIGTTNTISGLVSGGAVANTTNVWLDGPNAGASLAMPRAAGMSSDA